MRYLLYELNFITAKDAAWPRTTSKSVYLIFTAKKGKDLLINI